MTRNLLFLIVFIVLTVSHGETALADRNQRSSQQTYNVQLMEPSALELKPSALELKPSALNIMANKSMPSPRQPVVLGHVDATPVIMVKGYRWYSPSQGSIPWVIAYGVFNCFGSCASSTDSDDSDQFQISTRSDSKLSQGKSDNHGSGNGDGDKPPFSDYEKTIVDSDPEAGNKRIYLALIRQLLDAAAQSVNQISRILVQHQTTPTHALISWARGYEVITPTGPRAFSVLEAEHCEHEHWVSIFSALTRHHQDEYFDPSLLIHFFMYKDSRELLNLIIQSADTCVVLPGLTTSNE